MCAGRRRLQIGRSPAPALASACAHFATASRTAARAAVALVACESVARSAFVSEQSSRVIRCCRLRVWANQSGRRSGSPPWPRT
ncbi:hypothetical protein VTN02DRAFT_3836 [Thermoascus thermophilus]